MFVIASRKQASSFDNRGGTRGFAYRRGDLPYYWDDDMVVMYSKHIQNRTSADIFLETL